MGTVVTGSEGREGRFRIEINKLRQDQRL